MIEFDKSKKRSDDVVNKCRLLFRERAVEPGEGDVGGDGEAEDEINDWLRARLKKSEDELVNERNCVAHLTGMSGGACEVGGEDTTLPGEK